jgi:hypothetical protein
VEKRKKSTVATDNYGRKQVFILKFVTDVDLDVWWKNIQFSNRNFVDQILMTRQP